MIITHKIKMALDRRGPTPILDAVQGDKNSRDVEIALYAGDVPWNVPDNAIGIVRFKKPDRTGGVYDTMPDNRTRAVEISQNILTVRLAPQVLTAAGEVDAQVEMVLGDISLATFSFLINVAKDPSVGALDSEDYINVSSFVSAEVKRALKEDGLSEVETRLDAIEKDIADLKYVPIDITSISNSVGTVEMGSTVTSVTINWSINKQPANQYLDGAAVERNIRSKTLTGLSVTGTKTFNLEVDDERQERDVANTSITFLNGVYYGALDVSATYEDFSNLILHLTRKLQSSKALTFTADAGAKERLAYAIPSRYGTPTFTVGGLEGGFSKLLTDEFTNASGYTESYDLWVSDNLGLGSTTVVVK